MAKRTEPEILDQMNAFYYFKKDGIDTVRENFSDHTNFCLANQDKSYDEVKKMLTAELKELTA